MTSVTYETKSTAKSASTRLLDLLAGWAAFLSTEEESGVRDTALSAEEIGELYQEAGAASLVWGEMSAEEEEKAVRAFFGERILPLLARSEGTHSSTGDGETAAVADGVAH
jgi:hypothetical protein